MKKQGSLLEENTAEVFERAGFDVKKNSRVKGYEIDVSATKYGRTIICECKQYEKADLTIRNLIHQWDSKNKEIKADKVILVLYGKNPNKDDISLAKKYDMVLWDYGDIRRYSRIDKDKLIKEIFIDVGLKKGSFLVRLRKFLMENKKRQRTFILIVILIIYGIIFYFIKTYL